MNPNISVSFASQSIVRRNFLNIAGIKEQQELLHAEDRERKPAGYGRVYFGGNNSLTESGMSDVNNPVNCCVDGYGEDGKLGDGNIDMPKLQKQEHECEECRDLHELGDIIAEVDEYFCALPDKEYFKCLNVKPAIDANQNKDLEKINITCQHRCGRTFKIQYGVSISPNYDILQPVNQVSPCLHDDGITENFEHNKFLYYLDKAEELYTNYAFSAYDEVRFIQRNEGGTYGYFVRYGGRKYEGNDYTANIFDIYAMCYNYCDPCDTSTTDFTTLSTAKDTGLFYYTCQNTGYYKYIKCVHASDKKGRRYIFKGGMTNRRGDLVIMVQLQGHGVAEIRVEDGLLIDIYK